MNKIVENYDRTGHKVQSEIKLNKNGFYYREGTSDKQMIRDCTKDYPTVEFQDKIIFDCGSNIGAFTRLACLGGAKKVVAYEPEETNFVMAKMNTEEFSNVELINSAVSGLDDEILSFWINKSNNAQCSGALDVAQPGRRVEVKVNNRNFWKELDKYKPSLIKMDIEGGEYSIFEDGFEIPEYVKEIAIEIHKPKLMNELFEKLNKIFPNVLNKEEIIVFKNPGMIVAHLAR